MTKVKICGLSRPEDIAAVNEAKPDYAGFVFFEKSKRNISYERASLLLKELDPNIQSVAVCVSPDREALQKIEALGVDIIQIHGKISGVLLDTVRLPVWQAVNLSDGLHPEDLFDHPRIAGYVVDGANYGGGKTFGWETEENSGKLAEQIRTALSGRNLILAGGLNLENVALGIQLFAPDAVDVSSGVEKGAYKDREAIIEFVRKVRGL